MPRIHCSSIGIHQLYPRGLFPVMPTTRQQSSVNSLAEDRAAANSRKVIFEEAVTKNSLLLIIVVCSSSLFDGCGTSSAPPPPPISDFSIAISPSSVSTQVGATTSPVTVSLNAVNGFTGSVTVAVSGFPLGISSSPASSFTLSPGTAQQVIFSAPAAAGTFPLDFQGVTGTVSHSASATLNVTPQPNPYLVSASYCPWYQLASFAYTECQNGTLRGELVPSELPVLGK
jgi:hypothetical protein